MAPSGRGIGWQTDGKPRQWLTLSFSTGWTAAYRVLFDGDGPARRARIVELRIVPVHPTEFWERGNSAHAIARARAIGRAVAPFSFDAIRREITARRFTDALAAMASEINEESEADQDHWGHPVARLDRGPPPPRGAADPTLGENRAPAPAPRWRSTTKSP